MNLSLSAFEASLNNLLELTKPFAIQERESNPLEETWEELTSAQAALSLGISAFSQEFADRSTDWHKTGNSDSPDNATLHKVRKALHDTSNRCRSLTKQIDLVVKLASRIIDTAVKELNAAKSSNWQSAEISKSRKSLGAARATAVEALRRIRYFIRQADWIQERFPDAELRDVEGLVKLVTRSEIEEQDWSLTPGRYVGVTPEEEDEDFDLSEALRSIHTELKGLNEEAVDLAARIARNFEELGV